MSWITLNWNTHFRSIPGNIHIPLTTATDSLLLRSSGGLREVESLVGLKAIVTQADHQSHSGTPWAQSVNSPLGPMVTVSPKMYKHKCNAIIFLYGVQFINNATRTISARQTTLTAQLNTMKRNTTQHNTVWFLSTGTMRQQHSTSPLEGDLYHRTVAMGQSSPITQHRLYGTEVTMKQYKTI